MGPMPQAIFAMAGRFFATYAMNTGFQFSVEVLPTTLRGQGMAVVHLMSMVNLPDNLESMKRFGKNDRFFWMPLLGSDARDAKPKTSNKKEITVEDNPAFSPI